MSEIVSGYKGMVVCPKFDPNGIDNNYKLPNLRNVVEANFGNVLQSEATIYTYERVYDNEAGAVTSFTETPIPCYIVSAYSTDENLIRRLGDYADTFTNALGVPCYAIGESITFAKGIAS